MAPPNWKKKTLVSKKYRQFIIDHDCCITDTPGPNDPHHEQEEGHGTMAGKCGDERLIPLAHYLHNERTDKGRVFWTKYGKDPETIIQALHEEWHELTGQWPGR
jgi:hypothetical protein